MSAPLSYFDRLQAMVEQAVSIGVVEELSERMGFGICTYEQAWEMAIDQGQIDHFFPLSWTDGTGRRFYAKHWLGLDLQVMRGALARLQSREELARKLAPITHTKASRSDRKM